MAFQELGLAYISLKNQLYWMTFKSFSTNYSPLIFNDNPSPIPTASSPFFKLSQFDSSDYCGPFQSKKNFKAVLRILSTLNLRAAKLSGSLFQTY